MRHRTSRQLLYLWSRLPRTAARSLGALADLSPVRSVLAVVMALGLWTGGFVTVASVGGGQGHRPAAPQALGPPRSDATPSRDGDRPDVTEKADQTTGRQTPSSGAPGTGHPSKTDRSASPHSALSPSAEEEAPGSPSTESSASSSGATPSTTSEDDTPPDTGLSQEFPDRDGAVFSFSASEPATFTCSVDGSAFAPCDSPSTYSDLHAGWHTFSVRATDAAGNVDPTPAELTWHADRGRPADGQPGSDEAPDARPRTSE